ncbi:MAG: sodium:proton antiporter [Spirochaetaceae bacterium]|nr:sodium:proton antiporter [Spirochaetaceae bacterium]
MTDLLIGALFLVGLWGLTTKANLIKKIMALSICNSAVVLLFVYHGSLSGSTAPILGTQEVMVDPLPQALMLTAIVVGICVVALALVLIYRIYLVHKTLDIRVIEKSVWKLHD